MELAHAATCPETPGRVLVADDDDSSRLCLREVLEDRGYQVAEARDGREALASLVSDPTEVALLDVLMPKMDGFELCRRLKAHPATASIPVLLITGLSSRDDRLQGVAAGARDFLCKPPDIEDALLRVRNAVQAKRLYDRLQSDYRRLRELESLRDSLTHMVVHDMKTPLTVIKGYLDTLKAMAGAALGPGETACLDGAMAGAEGLSGMLMDVLDVSRIEAGELPLDVDTHSLVSVAREAIAAMGPIPGQARTRLVAPDGPVVACFDRQLIHRVIVNLLSNALRFTPAEGCVEVAARRQDAWATLTVTDQGPGIPPEYRERIFEKYGRAGSQKHRHQYSTGLGLAFCRLAAERHGGAIGVESAGSGGSRFWFTIPCYQAVGAA